MCRGRKSSGGDGNHIDIRLTQRFGGRFYITQGLAAIDFTSLLNSD